jgi:hypothetical protein
MAEKIGERVGQVIPVWIFPDQDVQVVCKFCGKNDFVQGPHITRNFPAYKRREAVHGGIHCFKIKKNQPSVIVHIDVFEGGVFLDQEAIFGFHGQMVSPAPFGYEAF